MRKTVMFVFMAMILLFSVQTAQAGRICEMYYNYPTKTLKIMMIERGFWTNCDTDPKLVQPDQLAKRWDGNYDVVLEQYASSGIIEYPFWSAFDLMVDAEIASIKGRNPYVFFWLEIQNFTPRDGFNIKARTWEHGTVYFPIDPGHYPESMDCELVGIYKDCSNPAGCKLIVDP